jgi:type II secretory ATPase GspE/PulE/Tfp pilus assembly ATPase PilB-like protein
MEKKLNEFNRDAVLAELAGGDFTLPRHQPLYIGRGCDQCKQSGYRGRIGIYELLRMDPTLRPLVMAHAPASEIRTQACRQGMTTLREDGWQKVLQGLTTVEEVVRVTRQDELEPVAE